jgi:hypothetical protein
LRQKKIARMGHGYGLDVLKNGPENKIEEKRG